MTDLVAKHRHRRDERIVRETTRLLLRSCGKLQRALSKSSNRWRPTDDDKPAFLASSTLKRALDYSTEALRILQLRKCRFEQALDLTRTALEHSYVLAIVAKEKQAGVDFVIEWERRNRVGKLRRLLASGHGDEEDRAEIQRVLDALLAQLGTQRVAPATVQDLVERANLGETHRFVYSRLSPSSHFDTASVLEAAYEQMSTTEERMRESAHEKQCEAAHALLGTLLHLAVARRDLGEMDLEELLAKGAKLLRETDAIALQVRDPANSARHH